MDVFTFIWYLLVALYWVFITACFGVGIFAIVSGEVDLLIYGILLILAGAAFLYPYIRYKKKEAQKKKEQEAAQKAEEARIQEINNNVINGKWEFPSEKYYCLCRDNQVKALNNEFCIRKATQLAEQLIKETAPDIDLANCVEYLKQSSLEGFLEKGEQLAKKTEERILFEQKQPRNANPNVPEKTFMQRASELAALSGSNKRVKMLNNLDSDYFSEIVRKINGEQALRQLGMIYAGQQQKESSWAIVGGIAEGIAGPAAGVMAAANTMANNRKIQEHNASIRKASMDIMSGIPSMAGDRIKLENEREKIKEALNESKTKVVLSKPTAEEIWQNMCVGKIVVKKNPSGVLAISVPVSLKEPFVLDVPDGVGMVVDGTIKGEVWFEDKPVGDVFFPLPLYGIPNNMAAEVTLDGMCGRSVEFDGEYTVKLAEKQNLWIMEAQFACEENSYIPPSNNKDKSTQSRNKSTVALSVDAATKYYKCEEWESTKNLLIDNRSWKTEKLQTDILYCISQLKTVTLSDLREILDKDVAVVRHQITPLMNSGSVIRIERDKRTMFIFANTDK